MKKYFLVFIMILAIMIGCGAGAKSSKNSAVVIKPFENPQNEAQELANSVIEKTGCDKTLNPKGCDKYRMEFSDINHTGSVVLSADDKNINMDIYLVIENSYNLITIWARDNNIDNVLDIMATKFSAGIQNNLPKQYIVYSGGRICVGLEPESCKIGEMNKLLWPKADSAKKEKFEKIFQELIRQVGSKIDPEKFNRQKV